MTRIPLSVPRGNARIFHFKLTEGDDALDPTGLTLTALVKDSEDADDATGTTLTVDLDDAATCAISFEVSGSLTATAGSYWWRVDVLDPALGGEPQTALYGPLTVIPV